MNTPEKNITLLEILVFVGILALVLVFSLVAINSARSKQRDATRLSNVRQIQSALEDYYNETNQYPNGDALPLGDATESACLSTTGFHGDCSAEVATIIRIVPRTYEGGLGGKVTCGNPARNAFCYSQKQNGELYGIQFELENGLSTAGLQKGVNCAIPGKMQAGACP